MKVSKPYFFDIVTTNHDHPSYITHIWVLGVAMRHRKLGSHTPPCHRRMVITTLFSVLLAALQHRPVLYHTRWLLAVHCHWSSGHGGQLAPTTHPQCRLVSNPCPAGRAPVMHLLSGSCGHVILNPQGRNGALVGAKASQHFSMCSVCQATQQVIAVLRVAHTISAPHHVCACCPHIHAYLLPSSSHGPHSRSPGHASAVQHVTTCRACGSGALRRPAFSFLDCSAPPWRPFYPGQLEPTLVSSNPGQLEPTTSLCVG